MLPPTEKIPEHLLPYIAKQDASLYTPIDHASWRFILKISRAYFATCAHQKYLDGLKETGISTERIPLIEEMDQCLRRFGWRAVGVSGFIPPAAFMEFQSLGILPIACEMRTLEHLAYTPAPDIVHEAAGHAPIIADQEYATYLRAYGEVARKAIFSSKDMAVYDAIRALSDIKEDPRSTPEQVRAAQKHLDDTVASVDYISEATYLARMNWWTVEYGLVGSLEEPKIYGAGLLSSVGESYHCLGSGVRKIPFTLDCVSTSYDITRPQPQLYVAPDFPSLTHVLEQISKTMAFRLGGIEALAKAIQAATVTTTVLDSGVQVSGIVTEYLTDSQGQPCFLRFQGPVQLAHEDLELEGHNPKYHREGFSTPIGRVKGIGKCAADLSPAELASLGFAPGKAGKMVFESGIELTGKTKGEALRRNGKNLVLSFEDCTIRRGDRILFQPEWGTFDLACGKTVTSVFGGAADRPKYMAATGGYHHKPGKPKSNLTEENRELNALYARVRKLRESAKNDQPPARAESELKEIHAALEARHPGDWLLRYELLELDRAWSLRAEWMPQIVQRLEQIGARAKDKSEMIQRGLALL